MKLALKPASWTARILRCLCLGVAGFCPPQCSSSEWLLIIQCFLMFYSFTITHVNVFPLKCLWRCHCLLCWAGCSDRFYWCGMWIRAWGEYNAIGLLDCIFDDFLFVMSNEMSKPLWFAKHYFKSAGYKESHRPAWEIMKNSECEFELESLSSLHYGVHVLKLFSIAGFYQIIGLNVLLLWCLWCVFPPVICKVIIITFIGWTE